MLEIRIQVQERYFRAFRSEIGQMRQKRASMAYDASAIAVQTLCGEIEDTLCRCRTLVGGIKNAK